MAVRSVGSFDETETIDGRPVFGSMCVNCGVEGVAEDEEEWRIDEGEGWREGSGRRDIGNNPILLKLDRLRASDPTRSVSLPHSRT